VIRELATALLLLAAAPPPAPEPTPARATPAPGERFLHNSGERTKAGIAALAQGDADGAISSFDAAARLAPDSPIARYNAGTARLPQRAAEGAPLLDQAAKAADAELAPFAWYNLGNAKLATGDSSGALAAYKESLRRRSDNADAKFNLELALRALEQKKKPSAEQQQSGQKKPQPQEKHPDKSGEQEQQSPSSPGRPQQAPREERANSPLPQFHDLKDMSAEKAAQILEAVDNLEREQRRQQALRRAARRSFVEIDW